MRVRHVLATVLLTLGLWTSTTGVAADSAADENLFVQMINELRTARGLNPLVVDVELTTQARAWAQQMADDDTLKHTDDMSVGVSATWDVLGENVGVHSIHDLDAIFRAFVDSPAHLDNLIDARFDYVGVGVIHTEAGKVWTTHRFMSVREPVAAASTPPTVAPTTVPPTTRPPTTAPPTTAPPTTRTPTTATPTTAPPTTAPPTTRVPTTRAPTTRVPPTAPRLKSPSQPTTTSTPTTAPPQTAAPTTVPPTTVARAGSLLTAAATAPNTTALPVPIDPSMVTPLGAIDASLLPADESPSPTAPDVGRLAQIITQVADAGI